MLQERYFESWTTESILDLLLDPKNKELLSIAKEIYSEEYKTFCKEWEDGNVKFKTFIDEVLMEDEETYFIEIMEAYVVKHNIKAALCNFTRNFDSDNVELWINQVVPTSQKDLDELTMLYKEYKKPENIKKKRK